MGIYIYVIKKSILRVYIAHGSENTRSHVSSWGQRNQKGDVLLSSAVPLRNYFFMCLVKRLPGTVSEFPCPWFRKATHWLLYPFYPLPPPHLPTKTASKHTRWITHIKTYTHMHTVQEDIVDRALGLVVWGKQQWSVLAAGDEMDLRSFTVFRGDFIWRQSPSNNSFSLCYP